MAVGAWSFGGKGGEIDGKVPQKCSKFIHGTTRKKKELPVTPSL
jgi:hypothetical protein